jgi:uncharacterized membrane protein
MGKNRLEAFSDGVIAIIITIMVLEFKVPREADLTGILAMAPVFISYLLSYIYIGIYWSNHHHLMQVVQRVNGPVLWANLHLLFWLSLVPFVTAWMGQHPGELWPVVLYGCMLLAAAIAYYFLTLALLKIHDANSKLAQALGRDFKGKVSIIIYLCAIGLSFWHPWCGYILYGLVALMWLVPDRRIEKVL